MNSSNSDIPKRRGRPATGRDPLVGVRFTPEQIERIDRWAGENGLTRAAAIRQIVNARLDQEYDAFDMSLLTPAR